MYTFPLNFTRLCERIGPNLRKDDSCDITLFFYHELFIKKDRYGLSAMLTLAAKKKTNYLGVRNFYSKKVKTSPVYPVCSHSH